MTFDADQCIFDDRFKTSFASVGMALIHATIDMCCIAVIHAGRISVGKRYYFSAIEQAAGVGVFSGYRQNATSHIDVSA